MAKKILLDTLKDLSFIDKGVYEILDKENNNYGFIIIKGKNNAEIIFNNSHINILKRDQYKNKYLFVSSNNLSQCKIYKNMREIISDIFNFNFNNHLYLLKINDILIEIKNKKYFIHNTIIDEYLGKHKIDFVFPNFSIILKHSRKELFVLRNVKVPFTYLNIKNQSIKNAWWIIPYKYHESEKIIVVNYPFNTQGFVCSKLNERLKTFQKLNYIHWYSELPSIDIPSIISGYLPVLLYVLKHDKHELIPLIFHNNEHFILGESNKINLEFKIKVNLLNKHGKILESATLEGKIEKYKIPKSLEKYIIDKYGNDIILEDEIDIEKFKNKEI